MRRSVLFWKLYVVGIIYLYPIHLLFIYSYPHAYMYAIARIHRIVYGSVLQTFERMWPLNVAAD